ncbi:hypothetical protein BHE74_00042744 [Ensete ventricosum]|nr:hypothetical protein BHE74_00042744 [Ensete ventricosum]
MQENDAAPTALSFGLLCLFPYAKNYSSDPHRPQLRPSPLAPINRQQLAFLAAATAISSSLAPVAVATFSIESSPVAPLLTALAAAPSNCCPSLLFHRRPRPLRRRPLPTATSSASTLRFPPVVTASCCSRNCCNLDQSLFRCPATAYAPSFLLCMPRVGPPLLVMPTPFFSVRLTKSTAVKPSWWLTT